MRSFELTSMLAEDILYTGTSEANVRTEFPGKDLEMVSGSVILSPDAESQVSQEEKQLGIGSYVVSNLDEEKPTHYLVQGISLADAFCQAAETDDIFNASHVKIRKIADKTHYTSAARSLLLE
ncbi:hypothetical protein CMO91_02110 [Candidatus Woesearchaeota archaeon]|nr:hypothetical protein [Candidatus Woesearchaeota archaeon]